MATDHEEQNQMSRSGIIATEESDKSMPANPLCGCLLRTDASGPGPWLSTSEVAMIEWRVDHFLADHGLDKLPSALEQLARPGFLPVIVTCRSRGQGGLHDGDSSSRRDIYRRAAEAGARWLDLEWGTDEGLPADLKHRGSHCRLLLSYHDFAKTPPSSELRERLGNMADSGADAVKVVTQARSPDDALRVLDLIHYGGEALGLPVVAFCMGKVARWSRVVCSLLGSPWSYVRLPGQPAAAAGQLYAAEAMRTLQILGWNDRDGGIPPGK